MLLFPVVSLPQKHQLAACLRLQLLHHTETFRIKKKMLINLDFDQKGTNSDLVSCEMKNKQNQRVHLVAVNHL